MKTEVLLTTVFLIAFKGKSLLEIRPGKHTHTPYFIEYNFAMCVCFKS